MAVGILLQLVKVASAGVLFGMALSWIIGPFTAAFFGLLIFWLLLAAFSGPGPGGSGRP